MVNLETLSPQVLGLTEASRPSTLRTVSPKSAMYKRMKWMQQLASGMDDGSGDEDDSDA